MTIEVHRTVRRLLVLLALTALVGCGGGQGGTDRPEDCDEDEYYDEGNNECITCPAVVEPDCRPGCGTRVVEDGRECPVLECEVECGPDGD